MSPVKKSAVKKSARGASRRAARTPRGEPRMYSYATIHKDPLDLRDYLYEGSLAALPRTLDNRAKVPRPILNQEREGACTGFGLAAVVNFLIGNDPDARGWKAGRRDWQVSPRMLYEMAKRYDEWPGEDYEGSSIRAAMKGWHRHGVCRESLWKYEAGVPGRPSPGRLADAGKRPLGNYFRVRHLHLSHMHAALREVGILYGSARVHEGWVRPRRGRIVQSTAYIGGHAFAIVGYDAKGLWIQNSWGETWGDGGFAHLSYDDWLENGWDCWVARLGVPMEREVPTVVGAVGGRSTTLGTPPREADLLHTIRPHFVNLGNDGRLSASGRYSTTLDDLRDIFEGDDGSGGRLAERMREWTRPRILLYAHGGLNDEAASAQRIAAFLPHFLANGIYPLHFMWETGFLDTMGHLVQDAFRRKRLAGWSAGLLDRFRDLLDEAIELGARPLGRPLWNEMKENARLASGPDGGAAFTAACLAAFLKRHPKVELHLCGHSAGSILHAHLIPHLAQRRVPVKSLTLLAPAVRTRAFRDLVLPRLGGPLERLAVFNLRDGAERDDAVGPYGKSLLYLVSQAFEPSRGEALLGMERFRDADDVVRNALGAPHGETERTVVYATGVPAGVTLTSASRTHGGFDDDPDTMNSLIRWITGRPTVDEPFTGAAAPLFGPVQAAEAS